MDEYIILTKTLLNAGLTPTGNFYKKLQIKIFGVPTKKWKKYLINRKVLKSKYDEFIQIKENCLNKITHKENLIWKEIKIEKPFIESKIYQVLNNESNLIKGLSYKKFLKSKYWFVLRKYILNRDNNKCKICEYDKDLNVHHTTYINHFNEHNHLEDLITLCNNCHKKTHKKSTY